MKKKILSPFIHSLIRKVSSFYQAVRSILSITMRRIERIHFCYFTSLAHKHCTHTKHENLLINGGLYSTHTVRNVRSLNTLEELENILFRRRFLSKDHHIRFRSQNAGVNSCLSRIAHYMKRSSTKIQINK